MSDTRELLVELGTEELPPKSLEQLSLAFRDHVRDGLVAAGLCAAGVEAQALRSPRRLAVKVAAVRAAQADQIQERLGPAVQAAFDAAGKPTRAAEGFAASCGLEVAALERRQTDKGERLAATVTITGRSARAIIPELLASALQRLPISRRMRWGEGDAEFVRPVHWVVVLLGEDVIPCTLLGVTAGRVTHGHRFHAPAPIELRSPADYPHKLDEFGWVRVNDGARTLDHALHAMVEQAAAGLDGEAVGLADGDGLLAEVAALNEWPVPVVGHFDRRYLGLPEEVLIITLQQHQRYFPVRDRAGALQAAFITFANIESTDADVVRRGNERVVEPRLDDAMFFWNQDRQRRLDERAPLLTEVVFQKGLGTLAAKQQRIGELAVTIAGVAGADGATVERAAVLAKCDLLTDMVGEFPELQGIMGRYYALADGEPAPVAEAIEEQYLPRFAGDRLPAGAVGRTLAIADKLDTICGIFSLGKKPSGDKDPFGLRRLALGLVRIVIECGVDLDLKELIAQGLALQPMAPAGGLREEVYEFLMDRLRAYYQDRGVRTDVFEAVLAKRPARPVDFARRIAAVETFLQLPAAQSLAAANKRIANILRQAGQAPDGHFDTALLTEAAEVRLGAAVDKLAEAVVADAEAGRYEQALGGLAALRDEVDAFFDDVLVNCEDEAVRANRLRLLGTLNGLFLYTADLAQIQVT